MLVPLKSNLPEEAKHFIDSTVRVTLGKAFEIESSTRNQSSNGEWFKLGQCRLTASNFANVLKRKKKTAQNWLRDLLVPTLI